MQATPLNLGCIHGRPAHRASLQYHQPSKLMSAAARTPSFQRDTEKKKGVWVLLSISFFEPHFQVAKLRHNLGSSGVSFLLRPTHVDSPISEPPGLLYYCTSRSHRRFFRVNSYDRSYERFMNCFHTTVDVSLDHGGQCCPQYSVTQSVGT